SFSFEVEDGIRVRNVPGVQTCALPIWETARRSTSWARSLSVRAPFSLLDATLNAAPADCGSFLAARSSLASHPSKHYAEKCSRNSASVSPSDVSLTEAPARLQARPSSSPATKRYSKARTPPPAPTTMP